MPAPAPIAFAPITALILCGGQARRMGGIDKGLQALAGQPLVAHVLQGLRQQSLPPAAIHISANRHLDTYARWGLPVWPDEWPDEWAEDHPGPSSGIPGAYAGPLAGVLTGLRHCHTPLLLTLPCDVPCFPQNLCEQLALALHQHPHARAASVAVRDVRGPLPQPRAPLRPQPVFSLLRCGPASPQPAQPNSTDNGPTGHLAAHLAAYLRGGGRRVGAWLDSLPQVQVPFDAPDARSFANLNTLQDLQDWPGKPNTAR